MILEFVNIVSGNLTNVWRGNSYQFYIECLKNLFKLFIPNRNIIKTSVVDMKIVKNNLYPEGKPCYIAEFLLSLCEHLRPCSNATFV